MKNLVFLLFITAVSTVANANNLLSIPKGDSEIALAKNEANNLELWKSLDTNEDDLISKAEIASAKDIIKSWEELDTNKDGKIDFFEFSRVPVKSI